MKLDFFRFHSPSIFLFIRFDPHYFNKFKEKNKLLIKKFSTHFS